MGSAVLMGFVALEAASPSVQRFYTKGVPHTGRHGKALNTWDPDRGQHPETFQSFSGRDGSGGGNRRVPAGSHHRDVQEQF